MYEAPLTFFRILLDDAQQLVAGVPWISGGGFDCHGSSFGGGGWEDESGSLAAYLSSAAA